MSNQLPPEARQSERSSAERSADHATIAGSIDELLPALIAKLGATGLAELEIREDNLRVRLRRPADAANSRDGRSSDRDRGERSSRSAGAAAHVAGLTPVGPGRDGREATQRDSAHREGGQREDPRAVATSPAVGIYQPRAEARAGTRVRAGDRLGTVDMLGVPQEVVAPSDGLIGASLVESGEAVEYGQELVVIEFASVSAPSASPPGSPGAGPNPPAGPGR